MARHANRLARQRARRVARGVSARLRDRRERKPSVGFFEKPLSVDRVVIRLYGRSMMRILHPSENSGILTQCTSPAYAVLLPLIVICLASGSFLRAADDSGNTRTQSGEISKGNKPTNADLAATSLAEGLLSYYPFNGNANDEAGGGFHGVVHNAQLTSDRFGNAGQAYYFDGASSIDFGANQNLGRPSTAFTVTVWFKAEGFGPIFTDYEGTGSGGDEIFAFSSTIDNNPVNSSLPNYLSTGSRNYPALGLDHTAYNSDVTFIGRGWHALAYVMDGAGNCRVYIDGTPKAVLPYNPSLDYVQAPRWQAGRTLFAGDELFFTGGIDDIRIYTRVLTDGEVQQLYLQEKEEKPPLIYDGSIKVTVIGGGVDDHAARRGYLVRQSDSSGHLIEYFTESGQRFYTIADIDDAVIETLRGKAGATYTALTTALTETAQGTDPVSKVSHLRGKNSLLFLGGTGYSVPNVLKGLRLTVTKQAGEAFLIDARSTWTLNRKDTTRSFADGENLQAIVARLRAMLEGRGYVVHP